MLDKNFILSKLEEGENLYYACIFNFPRWVFWLSSHNKEHYFPDIPEDVALTVLKENKSLKGFSIGRNPRLDLSVEEFLIQYSLGTISYAVYFKLEKHFI